MNHFHASHKPARFGAVGTSLGTFATRQDAADRARSYAHSWRRTGVGRLATERTLRSDGHDGFEGINSNGFHTQSWLVWECASRACPPPVRDSARKVEVDSPFQVVGVAIYDGSTDTVQDVANYATTIARATGSVGATVLSGGVEVEVSRISCEHPDDEPCVPIYSRTSFDPHDGFPYPN